MSRRSPGSRAVGPGTNEPKSSGESLLRTAPKRSKAVLSVADCHRGQSLISPSIVPSFPFQISLLVRLLIPTADWNLARSGSATEKEPSAREKTANAFMACALLSAVQLNVRRSNEATNEDSRSDTSRIAYLISGVF